MPGVFPIPEVLMHKPDTSQPLAHSQRYSEALAWAAELHGRQKRKGKEVPYIKIAQEGLDVVRSRLEPEPPLIPWLS